MCHEAPQIRGTRARRETRELCASDEKRPDIVTAVSVMRGKPWASHFACADTVALTYLPETRLKAGLGADTREARKFASYPRAIHRLHFSGVGIETCGSFGLEASMMVSHLGRLTKGEIRRTAFFWVFRAVYWCISPARQLYVLPQHFQRNERFGGIILCYVPLSWMSNMAVDIRLKMEPLRQMFSYGVYWTASQMNRKNFSAFSISLRG